jgi:hypothetical protein
MFTNSLSKGVVRHAAGKRSTRSTKPILERLDTRIALSGIAAGVIQARNLHMPLGSPTHIPVVLLAPPFGLDSPGTPSHGPGQFVPNGGFTR